MQPRELGYVFHPFPDARRVGFSRLVATLLPIPSNEHFDPEQVEVQVQTPSANGIELIRVEHPWPRSEQYRAQLGRVVLRDRRDKVVEAFTFGGELEVQASEARTQFCLSSPAPIFNLVNDQDADGLLVQEVEILLAERRAAWANDPEAYEFRLLALDPLTLYAACLASLLAKFARYPAQDDERLQAFQHLLRSEAEFHSRRSLPLDTVL